jgi:hypothetical protein
MATPVPEGSAATDAGAETVQSVGTPETVRTATDVGREAAAGLPPGLLFFAGGAFVLAAVAVVWYWQQ